MRCLDRMPEIRRHIKQVTCLHQTRLTSRAEFAFAGQDLNHCLLCRGVLGQFLAFRNPNSTTRVVSVRSNVRLTMPLGANLVSSASETTFSVAGSIKGFSLISQMSHESERECLMQVKQAVDLPDKAERKLSLDTWNASSKRILASPSATNPTKHIEPMLRLCMLNSAVLLYSSASESAR